MPTFTVSAAHRETGEETTLTITADTKLAATSKANTMGFVVSDVNLTQSAPTTEPPPSATHTYTAASPVGVPLCPLCRSRLIRGWTGATSGSSALGIAIVAGGLFVGLAGAAMVNSIAGWLPGLGLTVFGFVVGLRGRSRMICTSCHYRSNA